VQRVNPINTIDDGPMTTAAFEQAAQWIRAADGLLITAGAGMGVDSGLPDFRGAEGFWKAYPALAQANIVFSKIACPQAFEDDPALAWGFYGHRLALYRRTIPHHGFEILRNIADRLQHGAFAFTSNVDGQFQKAGFAEDRMYECHGSIHRLQCFATCAHVTWDAGFDPIVDEMACRMTSPLPRCPDCNRLARPNILMFHDWGWFDQPVREQAKRFTRWRANCKNAVIIELGAGVDIPSVRLFSEDQARFAPLIRINPRAPNRPRRGQGVSLAMGAREAMEGISSALYEAGFWDGG
jgi:NAD-dependent SIR2 family protein deacetylase